MHGFIKISSLWGFTIQSHNPFLSSYHLVSIFLLFVLFLLPSGLLKKNNSSLLFKFLIFHYPSLNINFNPLWWLIIKSHFLQYHQWLSYFHHLASACVPAANTHRDITRILSSHSRSPPRNIIIIISFFSYLYNNMLFNITCCIPHTLSSDQSGINLSLPSKYCIFVRNVCGIKIYLKNPIISYLLRLIFLLTVLCKTGCLLFATFSITSPCFFTVNTFTVKNFINWLFKYSKGLVSGTIIKSPFFQNYLVNELIYGPISWNLTICMLDPFPQKNSHLTLVMR